MKRKSVNYEPVKKRSGNNNDTESDAFLLTELEDEENGTTTNFTISDESEAPDTTWTSYDASTDILSYESVYASQLETDRTVTFEELPRAIKKLEQLFPDKPCNDLQFSLRSIALHSKKLHDMEDSKMLI